MDGALAAMAPAPLADAQEDSTGWRGEAGIEIPIGDSQWTAVPGIELERLEAEHQVVMETNRFFVNFVYTFPR